MEKLFLSLLPIETERLIIRLTTIEDIDLILKLDKQENTQKYLGGVKTKTKEERIEFLQKKEEKHKNGKISSLTVFLKESNTPIAFVGLKVDKGTNSAEISYIFDEGYTKKGYCTESVEKLIEIAFTKMKINKLYADTVTENESSKKVLLRLGFKKTGTKQEENILFDEYELYNKEKIYN